MMPPATENREFFRKKFLEGKWRWVAFLAIYFLSGVSGLWLPRLPGVPSSYPGSDPPWYFIRQDFFHAIGCFVGMVAMLLILGLTWRRYTFSNWLLLMMVAVWMVPSILTGIVIYSRCTDLFDYGHAVSAWPTFDAYSHSGIKFVGLPFGFGLALAIAGIGSRRIRETQKMA